MAWRPATLHSTTAELRLCILPGFGDLQLGEIERHTCSLFLEKLARKFSRAVVPSTRFGSCCLESILGLFIFLYK